MNPGALLDDDRASAMLGARRVVLAGEEDPLLLLARSDAEAAAKALDHRSGVPVDADRLARSNWPRGRGRRSGA